MDLETYLANHPKKNLVFDVDWTLVALHVDWDELLAHLEKELAVLDPELMKSVDNLSFELYNVFINKFGEKARSIIRKYYRRYEIDLIKGLDRNQKLLDFLERNKGKYKYYIWSNNQKETIEKALGNKYLGLFTKILSADNNPFFKSDTTGFFKVLFDEKNENKNNWLMIGDSNNDAKAAQNAGVDFFRIIFRPSYLKDSRIPSRGWRR